MYLQEHIIHVWEETGADFHNCLIQLYCEKVQGLMKEYLNSFPAGMLSLFLWEDQGQGIAQSTAVSLSCSHPEADIPSDEGTGTTKVVGL